MVFRCSDGLLIPVVWYIIVGTRGIGVSGIQAKAKKGILACGLAPLKLWEDGQARRQQPGKISY